VELPFTLTHPKPPPTPSPSRQFDLLNTDDPQAIDVPLDHNLIQLDAKFVFFHLEKNNTLNFDDFDSFDSVGHDDDFIFEEFARIRLKGHDGGLDDTEA
jgi:beta-arrestin